MVASVELEEVEAIRDNFPVEDHFAMHDSGAINVPVTIPRKGEYRIEVVAWADQAGDEIAKLGIALSSNTETSAGGRVIRAKLAELHRSLLGVEAHSDSPDVRAAFDLFVDVWNRGRSTGNADFRDRHCDYWVDEGYFEGILDGVWYQDKQGHWQRDWERVNDFIWRETDMPDPHYVARTWVVVLAYLMTDPRYLHL